MRRRRRWRLEALRSRAKDNQGFFPLISGLVGIALALLADRYGPDPDPGLARITVSQSRTTGFAIMGLLFSGLAIVLALASMTAQNMATRFSPRLFRLKLQARVDKLAYAAIALTSGFVITSLVQLRLGEGDDLVPPLGPAASTALFVVATVMIVWFINSSMQSIRVDRTIRWVAGQVVRIVELDRRAHRHDEPTDADVADRRPGAIVLVSSDDGYVVDIETDRLEELATASEALVVIESEIGRPLVRGEAIGWVTASSPPAQDVLEQMAGCVALGDDRDPRYDAGFEISVMVDIALMALSPAVNDPHTGVQCVEELTVVLTTLADRQLGPRARHGEDGTLRVLVNGERVGDYLDFAAREILLYGQGDPTVVAALARLAAQVERVARSDEDREKAAALAAEIAARQRSGSVIPLREEAVPDERSAGWSMLTVTETIREG